MKILRFDSLGGASGDMILGALCDLGVRAADLQEALATLPIESFSLEAGEHKSHHLRGTLVEVQAPHEGHVHRGLRDIRAMLEESALPPDVLSKSLRVFERIAEAEAAVHGTTPEKVHFHEVGALDSIIDIVGACLALHRLGVDGVSVAPLPLGCGMIECAHGTFPAPAPATVELLKGFPTTQTKEPHELVTPTGAALLSTWHDTVLPPPGSLIRKVGYGFGHRELARRPNVLRATLLETAPGARAGEQCLVLQCNVDDTTPELMGALVEALLEAGALDAFTTPVHMKKQRPGILLTVLCLPERRDVLVDLVFRECTTFGLREYMTARTVLGRRHAEVETPFGKVRIKVGRWHDEEITFAPEMDDCLERARAHGVAVRKVYEAALLASRELRA